MNDPPSATVAGSVNDRSAAGAVAVIGLDGAEWTSFPPPWSLSAVTANVYVPPGDRSVAANVSASAVNVTAVPPPAGVAVIWYPVRTSLSSVQDRSTSPAVDSVAAKLWGVSGVVSGVTIDTGSLKGESRSAVAPTERTR